MMEYEVGEFARLKAPVNANEDTLCACEIDSQISVDASRCWHGPGTVIRRVFHDGFLLLENRSGSVRVAQPDEVCR